MHPIKKVVFLGRKSTASMAIDYLLKKNIKVSLIVAPEKENYKNPLSEIAHLNNIPFISDNNQLYMLINANHDCMVDVDLVISYLYWRRIKMPLIKLPSWGCINFHPAPLPDYKSRAGYNIAILDERDNFGVSVHYIDSEVFDAGPIIKVSKFPIDPQKETVISLEKKSQIELFKLFTETIDMFQRNELIRTKLNKGGLYLTADDLEKLKIVNPEKDSAREINKKIRAFFFPPYAGAKIVIDGEDFTLVNKEVLNYIHEILSNC